MPPLTFTLDKMRVNRVRLTREGAADVVAIGEYDVLTSTGQFPTPKQHTFVIPPAMQTTLNQMWDAGIVQINTKEGTTTFSG